MAGIRMTGLASGLDTESLVGQLSKAYQTKVDNAKKKQTKAEWKKEAWASLNTKIFNFYKDALSTFKSTGTYSSKKVNGTLSGVKITAGSSAVTGNHKIKVLSSASAQMWTGKQINGSGTEYTATSYKGTNATDQKLSELYDQNGYSNLVEKLDGVSFTVQDGDQSADVTLSVNNNTTVDDLIQSVNGILEEKNINLKATFKDGSLVFTNNNTEPASDSDSAAGTSDNSKAITITATSENAFVLGLTKDQAVTIKAASSDPDASDSQNVFTTSSFAYEQVRTEGASVTAATRLTDLETSEHNKLASGTEIKVTVGEGDNAHTETIKIDQTTTLSSLAKELSNKGINASYDATQGRFYLSSKETGAKFDITAVGPDGASDVTDDLKEILGLDITQTDIDNKVASMTPATQAIIEYNGVRYTQSDNTFSINGLTIDVTSAEDNSEQSFSVETDVDSIYDKVKNFVKEYNALIKEMNTLYSAESSRGYEPLTSEEKDAMTDDEVEQWEKKIKDSLLRRDSTISTLLSSMRTTLNKSVEVTNADGTTSRYALTSFGIDTGSYTENGMLHILGDPDDSDYLDQENRLKATILANPEALMKTLTTLGNEMYSNLQTAMKSSEVSSALTFYNDKQFDSEIKDYKDDVKALQQKLQDEEDKYYKQFSAMETAMAKLQSQQTYISQLFGGGA